MPPNIIKHLGELLGIVTVLGGIILSIGWSYAYTWFSFWQMPFSHLGLSTEHLFEYGRLALTKLLASFIVFGGFGIACFLPFFGRGPISAKPALPYLAIIIIAVVWLSTHSLGRYAANRDIDTLVEANFEQLPVAEITTKPNANLPKDLIRDTSEPRLCYRVVFVASDALWIARLRDSSRVPLIAMIPRDQITMLRIHHLRGNCSPGLVSD